MPIEWDDFDLTAQEFHDALQVRCKKSLLFSPLIIMAVGSFFGSFLNQARTGLYPARAWFLKIDPVRIVCVHACVCVFPPQGY